MFTNLNIALDQRFWDHNFSDFLDRIEQVPQSRLISQLEDSWLPWKESPFDPNEFFAALTFTLDSRTCASFFRKHAELPVFERDYYLSKVIQFISLMIASWLRNIGYPEWDWETRFRERLHTALDAVPTKLLPTLTEFKFWKFHDALSNCDRLQPLASVEALLGKMNDFMPGSDVDDSSEVDAGAENRRLLEEYRRKTRGTAASVYEELGIDKADFYRWCRGKLSSDSGMAKRIKGSLVTKIRGALLQL